MWNVILQNLNGGCNFPFLFLFYFLGGEGIELPNVCGNELSILLYLIFQIREWENIIKISFPWDSRDTPMVLTPLVVCLDTRVQSLNPTKPLFYLAKKKKKTFPSSLTECQAQHKVHAIWIWLMYTINFRLTPYWKIKSMLYALSSCSVFYLCLI